MEDMMMEVLGSPLMLRKLQNMQGQPYEARQQDDYINYMRPSSSPTDLHAHHDLIHHDDACMSRSMLLQPSSSLPSPHDAIVNLLLANGSSFPYVVRKREEKEEDEGIMLVSSLPFSDAQLLGSTANCFSLGGHDGRDLDSSYSTQVLQYASGGGGSGRNSSDLSSPYNTPISECAQCSIDHPSSSSRQYLSQTGSAVAHTSLISTEEPDLSGLLRQSIKDEPHCLVNDVREVHQDGPSYITQTPQHPHLQALSGTSSCSSTPTSMTSALTSCHHLEVQANMVMAFDDSYNPANNKHPHGDEKLSEMANTVVVKQEGVHQQMNGAAAAGGSLHDQKRKKRKRKRTSHKNVQEMESQRMTHIAVERNRRKQMNEHLHALRMLMPHSYIQRGDQASIVGGTIRFIEELEQVLQALQFQKKMQSHQEFETLSANFDDDDLNGACTRPHKQANSHVGEVYASVRSSMADVEVTMVTSSIIIAKVLTQKRPHQLLHTLLALSGLSLKVMHINITATEFIILYCFNLEMEDDCQLHTCNEIAKSFQHIFSV